MVDTNINLTETRILFKNFTGQSWISDSIYYPQ